MKIGILALQGAIEPHALKLQALGVEPVEVRLPRHLEGIAGIILPGGESTAMIRLLHKNQLWNDLQNYLKTHPAWGVCAGSILLARKVEAPEQASLDVLDITIERNAFGRQLDSFEADLEPTADWKRANKETLPVPGVFIRAPRIRKLGDSVRTLLTWKDEPVMVQSGNTLASTFHPELTDSSEVHQYFISLCQ